MSDLLEGRILELLLALPVDEVLFELVDFLVKQLLDVLLPLGELVPELVCNLRSHFLLLHPLSDLLGSVHVATRFFTAT